ncbi:MAG: thioredoxin family protein [Eubacteriaceae bacterium]|jgi:thioredoxin 1|nr:thioredoxin family protein [Eubacteriaceae bacterium]
MDQRIVQLTAENFEKEVHMSEIPVFVDVWADWCAPCRRIAPLIESLADEYSGRVKVAKLNVEDERDFVRAKFPDLLSIPTVLLFRGGELAANMVGAFRLEEYRKAVASELLGVKSEPKTVALTGELFEQEVYASQIPVIVDVWSEWCVPCHRIAPIMDILADEFEGLVKVGKLNAESEELFVQTAFPDLMSVPTVLFFRQGALIGEMVGAFGLEAYEEAIRYRLLDASENEEG